MARHLRLVERPGHLRRLEGHSCHRDRRPALPPTGEGPAGPGAGGAEGLTAGASALGVGGGVSGACTKSVWYRIRRPAIKQGGHYRSFLHQARGSIKIDAPLLGVTTGRAADHTRPGGKDDSARACAPPASRPGGVHGGRAPRVHTPNNSAGSGRRPAGAAAGATDSPVPDRRRSCAPTLMRRRSRRLAASARAMSARSSSSGRLRGPMREPRRRRSTPRARPGSQCRYASRSRRLARFRRAAPRICLLTAKPARPGPLARYPEEHEGTSFLSSAGLEYRLDLVGLPEAGGAGKSECSDSSAHSPAARR